MSVLKSEIESGSSLVGDVSRLWNPRTTSELCAVDVSTHDSAKARLSGKTHLIRYGSRIGSTASPRSVVRPECMPVAVISATTVESQDPYGYATSPAVAAKPLDTSQSRARVSSSSASGCVTVVKIVWLHVWLE